VSARHLSLGVRGEEAAVAYLRQKKGVILERNYRCKTGEIDIICKFGQEILFVEVKTRSMGSMGLPGEAVNRAKQRRLLKAASRYLSLNRLWDRPCRFDLITVVQTPRGLDVEHFEDVIDATDIMGGRHSSWQPW
jgi:putative endonuclease